MIDLRNLMDIDGAIPFSALMNKQDTNKQDTNKHTKKTKKKSRSPSRKRKQKRNKRTKKKSQRVPPKGVIIRKKDKLYRSNGKSLQLL